MCPAVIYLICWIVLPRHQWLLNHLQYCSVLRYIIWPGGPPFQILNSPGQILVPKSNCEKSRSNLVINSNLLTWFYTKGTLSHKLIQFESPVEKKYVNFVVKTPTVTNNWYESLTSDNQGLDFTGTQQIYQQVKFRTSGEPWIHSLTCTDSATERPE